jgi:hypothetical protein
MIDQQNEMFRAIAIAGARSAEPGLWLGPGFCPLTLGHMFPCRPLASFHEHRPPGDILVDR